MADLTLESLGLPCWDELSDVYRQFKEQIPRFVSRWVYAPSSAGLERPERLWLERVGLSPASVVEGSLKGQPGAVRYGYTPLDLVPMWSKLHGPQGDVDTEWMRWFVGGLDLRLRFEKTGQQPELAEVVIERSEDDRVIETLAFTDGGCRIHREAYEYDAAGRVTLVASIDGTPSDIEARSMTDVSYDGDRPQFDEREVGPDDEFVWPPDQARDEAADEAAVEPQEPVAVTQASATMVELLSGAVASWYERAPDARDISHLLLLYDWPVNPPFAPGIIACSGELGPDGNIDKYLGREEPEHESWFDADPSEFVFPEALAAAHVLNDWFLDGDSERSPLKLYIDIARAAHDRIAQRTGRQVWVIPVDMNWELVGNAVVALLPREISGLIVEALSAGEANC